MAHASGRQGNIAPSGEAGGDAAGERAIRAIGADLCRTLEALVNAIPTEGRRTPSSLARLTGVNRVLVSRILNSIGREDTFETLHQIPGPESIRSFVRAADKLGVASETIAPAMAAADAFGQLIRSVFGTRSALNAAISAKTEHVQKRFEESSRYQVYQGMRQVLGIGASTWLNVSFFAPSSQHEDELSFTTIHGALGMQRLRSDVGVTFSFGPPFPAQEDGDGVTGGAIDLGEFCKHTPARLTSEQNGHLLVHRLEHEGLGKDSVVDMLTVSHNARASQRFATPDQPLRGISVFADIPVKLLVCDVFVHDDVFPTSDAELIVFSTGVRGPASPNDPSRAMDRIPGPETIEPLGKRADRLEQLSLPRYADMVDRVCGFIGCPSSKFRLYRLQMVYPIHGFQHVVAFNAPMQESD